MSIFLLLAIDMSWLRGLGWRNKCVWGYLKVKVCEKCAWKLYWLINFAYVRNKIPLQFLKRPYIEQRIIGFMSGVRMIVGSYHVWSCLITCNYHEVSIIMGSYHVWSYLIICNYCEVRMIMGSYHVWLCLNICNCWEWSWTIMRTIILDMSIK
jgi:hypothetical protein